MPHPEDGFLTRKMLGNRFACMREDGQALVELAIVLPLLLALVFGIVQFALALNSANDETHLANEVARYATVDENPGCAAEPCATGLAAWGKSQADSAALNGQTLCIRFPENPATKTTKQIGDPVEVVVKGAISWFPVLKLKATSTNIAGKAVMRLEAAPTTYGPECA
jgi:Flp pilus assembly protein TadG